MRRKKPAVSAEPALAYPHAGRLYVNLTNRCPVSCVFCVKRAWHWRYRGRDLRLGTREPGAEQAWRAVDALGARRDFRELVFCGYGESTLRLPVLAELGRRSAVRWPGLPRRLNTIGLGSLIWGRDIAPELRACLDAVSVSLNTADPSQWEELHAPRPVYRERGFAAVLDFISACVAAGLSTTVTAVDLPGVNLKAVGRLARVLGAGFRPRPLLIAAGPKV